LETSNGRMKAPILPNQSMFQTGYLESTVAIGGLTMYTNNVTINNPAVAGQVTNFESDRNLLFESDNNGVIMTDESLLTAQYGNLPMNGSAAALISGGSVGGNHLAGATSRFWASDLALSAQHSVMSGSIAIPAPLIGENPDLITLNSAIAAQGNSIGSSNVHAFAFDQTGLPGSNVVGTETSYSESVTFMGNFMVMKDFQWKLKARPTIQTFNPPTFMCEL